MSEYTAIIPVAGKGIRLLPYTEHCPKTMLCVAGKPIIAHILQQVEACGIRRVVFIVGYKKEALIDYIRRHYAHLETVFVEQTEPKGLGHAVYLAKETVQGPCFMTEICARWCSADKMPWALKPCRTRVVLAWWK